MKKFTRTSFHLCLMLFITSSSLGCLDATEKSDKNDNQLLKLSEAFGFFIGSNLKNPGINFDIDMLIKGIRDGAAGKQAPMSEEEYQKQMVAHQANMLFEISSQNLSNAEKFLNENAKKDGVTEIEPGMLQYEVLEIGNGAHVTETDAPQIDFFGKLLDDTVFGSSEQVGGPITIPLKDTIAGFKKGIVGMKEGEKRRLFIHPNLGYGTTGNLPPNALLIFEIKVLKANNEEEEAQSESASDDSSEAKIELNGENINFENSEDLDEEFNWPEW